MDFITVTLRENFGNGKTVSESGKLENYLLPVLAIKSISKSPTSNDEYYIEIIESYKPNDVDFQVDYAIATLPNRFINVLN